MAERLLSAQLQTLRRRVAEVVDYRVVYAPGTPPFMKSEYSPVIEMLVARSDMRLGTVRLLLSELPFTKVLKPLPGYQLYTSYFIDRFRNTFSVHQIVGYGYSPTLDTEIGALMIKYDPAIRDDMMKPMMPLMGIKANHKARREAEQILEQYMELIARHPPPGPFPPILIGSYNRVEISMEPPSSVLINTRTGKKLDIPVTPGTENHIQLVALPTTFEHDLETGKLVVDIAIPAPCYNRITKPLIAIRHNYICIDYVIAKAVYIDLAGPAAKFV